ncbi:MAG TPA: hypothetical protein VF173_20835 [Thermoanaerobaculia bacterium]|nr:hypothetical protein [Thermoanaerobaculia bacterium]
MRRNPAVFAILVGGSIAGVLDITYAIVFSWAYRDVPPMRILQSVASGLLGAPAYEGGVPTAALGLVLHFFIAFSAAAIFYFVSRKIPFLLRYAPLVGVLYGAGIYAFMNLVVIPLSAFPRKLTFSPLTVGTGLFVHMAFIGLPIALAARRASRLAAA